MKTLTFENSGQTFSALYKAQSWLKDNGYGYGSLCGRDPVAVSRGDYNLPQKWKNLSQKERAFVDGKIESHDFREGSVTVSLRV